MRCAMMERILVMGTSSPGSGAAAGAGAAGCRGSELRRWSRGGGRCRGLRPKQWLSRGGRGCPVLVMRPAEPVPGICAEVDVVVLGDLADQRRRAELFAASAEAGDAGGQRLRCRRCSGRRQQQRPEVRLPGTDAPPPITATMVLMPTVAPSCTLISVRMPATGEGISASTLSVEISKSGSSRSTDIANLLEPLGDGASVMDSPICGIRTSVPGPEAPGTCTVAGDSRGRWAAVASCGGRYGLVFGGLCERDVERRRRRSPMTRRRRC